MMHAGLRSVLEALEYVESDSLVTRETEEVPASRSYIWQEIQAKFGVDAAYFHGAVPVVYFKGLAAGADSDEDLAELHRQLWNHNRVPLFIAVLPQEVRVYNCFAPPDASRDRSHAPFSALLLSVHLAADILELRRTLDPFRRAEVESGRLARVHAGRFRRDQRVDQRLLFNLGQLRRRFLDQGLQPHVVNSLVGRSIFVKYLEDRGVLTPDFWVELAAKSSYAELLRMPEAKKVVYRLFASLAETFNGDMFPVDQVELDQIEEHHLASLGQFLEGANLATGQMALWPYDFNFIPIELISSIYEEFLHEERDIIGAFYTPTEIVDFVLNEVLPWGGPDELVRVLDPACGSGVFLVEAYRRLVMRRSSGDTKRTLSFDVLSGMLTSSIFGVDIKEDAIRVTAFSLYLALLDFLEPKSIWKQVRFPNLIGSNLFVADFFDVAGTFNDARYDVIIGNPPWQSRLSVLAQAYIQQLHRPVGDKQFAQAFLWRVPDLLTTAGRAGLLAPSKGVLFNQSGPNRAFRSMFFREYSVSAVADFSSFRRSLFQNATAPMVTVFYQHRAVLARDELRYYTPHPSPLSESLAGVVISGDEVKRLSSRKLLDHPDAWKIALWGTARDFAFIQDLRRRFPALGLFATGRGWFVSRGLQVGGGDRHHRPDLAAMTYIPVEALKPFNVTSDRRCRIGTEVFHRPRESLLYQPPHVLVRCGLLAGGVVAATFANHAAIFTDGIVGIAGPDHDTNILKLLSAYLNSSLARYFYFLTSGSWGVERDVIQLQEHVTFPFADLTERPELAHQILGFVDAAQAGDGQAWNSAELDALVFDAYALTPTERQLVHDTVTTVLDQFYQGTKAAAFAPPSGDELTAYAEAFGRVFQAALGRRGVTATVHSGRAPFRAVSFRFVVDASPSRATEVVTAEGLDDLLRRLDGVSLERQSASLYLRRNVKVFIDNEVHIVKPGERRFWTPSIGCNDADETIAQLFRAAVPS